MSPMEVWSLPGPQLLSFNIFSVPSQLDEVIFGITQSQDLRPHLCVCVIPRGFPVTTPFKPYGGVCRIKSPLVRVCDPSQVPGYYTIEPYRGVCVQSSTHYTVDKFN